MLLETDPVIAEKNSTIGTGRSRNIQLRKNSPLGLCRMEAKGANGH